MLASAHIRQDHMLTSAHTQDGTICWLVYTRQDSTLASAHMQDGAACCKAEGHDKSTSLLLNYLCDIFHSWIKLHVSFSAQVPRRKARMSSAQKMLLNAVNFTGSSDSKWTGQVRHGISSSQVSRLKY
jgi:hypothetical protein